MQRNRGKQQNGKDQRSIQENWRYQGNILCKDGHNGHRNGKNLTEVEDIKKRWQEYTELYKIVLMTWIPQWCAHLPGARKPGV